MKYVLCSVLLPCEMQNVLKEDGWEIVSIPGVSSLPAQIASHPDMCCCVLNNSTIVACPELYQAIQGHLTIVFDTVLVGATALNPSYPNDIPYNALVLGNRLFHLLHNTDSILLEWAKKNGYACINVSQGYTACSTLAISETALITADEGIAQTATAHGCAVLKIRSGGISLTGYSYGFIGGASGWDGGDTVYFCGDISLHPDGERITEFISSHGKKSKPLNGKPLYDYGGLKFIIR
ncbi:hypothetical protein KDK77_08950 [bacterium]|nr:hypothetical protein [bacterium]MCP5462637.1 hypothetical protein [bacterium]